MRFGLPERGSHRESPGKCAHTTYTWTPSGAVAISGSQSSPPQNPIRYDDFVDAFIDAPDGPTNEPGTAEETFTFGGAWWSASPNAAAEPGSANRQSTAKLT